MIQHRYNSEIKAQKLYKGIENGGFILKTHQVFFVYTIPEVFKTQQSPSFWICVWGKLGIYSVSQTNSNVPYRFVFIFWIKSVCTLFRGTLLFFHHVFAFAVGLVLALFFINFVLFITTRVFFCTCTTLSRALYLTEKQREKCITYNSTCTTTQSQRRVDRDRVFGGRFVSIAS